MRAVCFEYDGETVKGGKPGETWLAVYTVPDEVSTAKMTETEAEEYGAPAFVRISQADTDTAATLALAEARINAAVAYINAVETPNRLTLDHIKRMLTGRLDAFARLWARAAPCASSTATTPADK